MYILTKITVIIYFSSNFTTAIFSRNSSAKNSRFVAQTHDYKNLKIKYLTELRDTGIKYIHYLAVHIRYGFLNKSTLVIL